MNLHCLLFVFFALHSVKITQFCEVFFSVLSVRSCSSWVCRAGEFYTLTLRGNP